MIQVVSNGVPIMIPQNIAVEYGEANGTMGRIVSCIFNPSVTFKQVRIHNQEMFIASDFPLLSMFTFQAWKRTRNWNVCQIITIPKLFHYALLLKVLISDYLADPLEFQWLKYRTQCLFQLQHTNCKGVLLAQYLPKQLNESLVDCHGWRPKQRITYQIPAIRQITFYVNAN